MEVFTMKLLRSSLYDYELAAAPVRPKTKAQLIVEEFLDSKYDCAECIFTDSEYKNSSSLKQALYLAIRKMKCPCVARSTDNRVFLIKKSALMNV